MSYNWPLLTSPYIPATPAPLTWASELTAEQPYFRVNELSDSDKKFERMTPGWTVWWLGLAIP
jgi:hypothetical protein